MYTLIEWFVFAIGWIVIVSGGIALASICISLAGCRLMGILMGILYGMEAWLEFLKWIHQQEGDNDGEEK